MQRLVIKTKVKGSPKKIYSRFNKDLLLKLTPPIMDMEVTRFDGNNIDDQIHIVTNIFGLYQSWQNEIIEFYETENEVYFIDQGILIPDPLKSWRHKHIIIKKDELHSMIIDQVFYTTGSKIIDKLLYPIIFALMYYRKPIYIDTFTDDD